MGSRLSKSDKKAECVNSNSATFIERVRKVRALNCSPADVGINMNIMRKFGSHRPGDLFRLI